MRCAQKRDIEGAERKALIGARGTIARFHPRMAIATENLDDDYRVVPEITAKIGGRYRVSCGSCRSAGFAVRPDVIFFDRL